MRTYTLSVYGGDCGVTEYRAKSPETLARRLYGKDVTVRHVPAHTLYTSPIHPGIPIEERWEIHTPEGYWADDIFLT